MKHFTYTEVPPNLALIAMELIAKHAEKYVEHVAQLRQIYSQSSFPGAYVVGLAAGKCEYADDDGWVLHFKFTPARGDDGVYSCILSAWVDDDGRAWSSLFEGFVS